MTSLERPAPEPSRPRPVFTRRRATQAAAWTAISYSRIWGANERVGMGYIGLGNRGDQVHQAFLEYADQQTVAVCDLKQDYLDFAVQKSRANPRRYTDYRKLLEDPDVDAVVIATPDHWHAIQFIDACRAGKDVYVEKPLSLTVVEGRRMVEVAAETRRVTQVGLQRRSARLLQEAAQLVREGAIGPVTFAQAWHTTNEWPVGLGNPKPEVPADFDWDAWLGPAPVVLYTRARGHYTFRWFFPFSGGKLTNLGVHYMDTFRWFLGIEAPRAVAALGGRFAIPDAREIPDTLQVTWDCGNCLLVFTQVNANAAPGNIAGAEMMFRGTKGTLYVTLNGWEIVPERITRLAIPARTPLDRETERSYHSSRQPAMEPRVREGRVSNAPHAHNFLDCVKSRGQCHCDVLTGHRSTAATLIGNIALKTRSLLEWDAEVERFPHHPAANQLLHYSYRPPYKLG